MRPLLTTSLEVLGMALISVGVAMYEPAAGLVVAGAFLLAIGILNGASE